MTIDFPKKIRMWISHIKETKTMTLLALKQFDLQFCIVIL